ncbi:hypothetical protein BGZ58_006350, partial [Dissophora ornata]
VTMPSLELMSAWKSKSQEALRATLLMSGAKDAYLVLEWPNSVGEYFLPTAILTPTAFPTRQEATTAIWQRTCMTAMLRSILYSDDVNYRIPGFRKLDPIPDVDTEERFFKAAEQMLFKGWLLGSNPKIQVPTIVNNHLTAAVMKYCQESFRYDLGVKFFERLFDRKPE